MRNALIALPLILLPLTAGAYASASQTIEEGLHATAERLVNITDRMDTRATTLAQLGKDSSAVQPYLSSAREALDATAGPSSAREALEQLYIARMALLEALRILKEVDATAAASSTDMHMLEVQ